MGLNAQLFKDNPSFERRNSNSVDSGERRRSNEYVEHNNDVVETGRFSDGRNQEFVDDLNVRISNVPDSNLRNILRDIVRGEPSTYENSPHRERRRPNQPQYQGVERRRL